MAGKLAGSSAASLADSMVDSKAVHWVAQTEPTWVAMTAAPSVESKE